MPSAKWLATQRQLKIYLPAQDYDTLKAEAAKRGDSLSDAVRNAQRKRIKKATKGTSQAMSNVTTDELTIKDGRIAVTASVGGVIVLTVLQSGVQKTALLTPSEARGLAAYLVSAAASVDEE